MSSNIVSIFASKRHGRPEIRSQQPSPPTSPAQGNFSADSLTQRTAMLSIREYPSGSSALHTAISEKDEQRYGFTRIYDNAYAHIRLPEYIEMLHGYGCADAFSITSQLVDLCDNIEEDDKNFRPSVEKIVTLLCQCLTLCTWAIRVGDVARADASEAEQMIIDGKRDATCHRVEEFKQGLQDWYHIDGIQYVS